MRNTEKPNDTDLTEMDAGKIAKKEIELHQNAGKYEMGGRCEEEHVTIG